MAAAKLTDPGISKAIEALTSQGRDVTTSAILAALAAEGIKAKPSDLHASAAWKELLAKEDQKPKTPASEPKNAPKRTKEPTVAKTKKRAFPSKPCPKCGATIHARLQKHEKCGWEIAAKSKPAPVTKKKVGRPRMVQVSSNAGGISLQDIQAVKALADRLGAEKVWQLATVLAK